MSKPVGEDTLRSPRIKELEGLRGCLAWWVVLFHCYLEAGLRFDQLTKFEFWAAYGWVAVDLFIILSGYVITLLIETQRESYGVYITRRFFRIAPLYYLLCAYGAVEAYRWGTYGDLLIYHILLHLTMLHGLVPEELLRGSTNALNHPAWSISVEWQFYLLAPAILLLVRRSATRAFLLVAGCYLASKAIGRLYTFPFAATVVMRAGQFAIGIASYHLTRLVDQNARLARPLVPYLLPIGIAIMWIDGGAPLGGWTVWVVVFSSVLARIAGAETALTGPVRRFLGLPVVVWLGKLSYSTYLCHHLGFRTVKWALGPSFEAMTPRMRLGSLICGGFPVILALSFALYHLIERPGMWAGKVIAKKMGRKPVRTPPEVLADEAPALARGDA